MYLDLRLHNNILGFNNTSAEFEVSCVGRVIVDDINTSVERPNGLPDYQLLYIASGCGYFNFGNGFEKIGSKTVILFKPNEPQIYKYFTQDSPHTYWIHFSGNNVDNLLKQIELTNTKTVKIQNDIGLKDFFKKVIFEFQNRADAFSSAANNYAQLALIELSREIKNSKKKKADLEIENLCQKMRVYYYENISNNEYAEKCNMSVSHFLSKFRDVTGMSPQNYIINLRIANAKNLLTTTNYKINEISQLVGFTDSMYFCKRFKKLEGISPSEYRAKFQL